jgi:acyl dehydratase
MHIDLDVARSGGMDDVFAQGMLSIAYLGRLLTNYVPQAHIRSYGVRFASITPLHGKPTCTCTCTCTGTKIEDGLAHLDLTVTLADGTVTLRGDAVVTAA